MKRQPLLPGSTLVLAYLLGQANAKACELQPCDDPSHSQAEPICDENNPLEAAGREAIQQVVAKSAVIGPDEPNAVSIFVETLEDVLEQMMHGTKTVTKAGSHRSPGACEAQWGAFRHPTLNAEALGQPSELSWYAPGVEKVHIYPKEGNGKDLSMSAPTQPDRLGQYRITEISRLSAGGYEIWLDEDHCAEFLVSNAAWSSQCPADLEATNRDICQVLEAAADNKWWEVQRLLERAALAPQARALGERGMCWQVYGPEPWEGACAQLR